MSATEAARRLGDLLARVRYRGESFLIRRGRRIVAKLGPHPVEGVSGRDLAERLRGLPALERGEDRSFARDVERARKRVNRPPVDPWER